MIFHSRPRIPTDRGGNTDLLMQVADLTAVPLACTALVRMRGVASRSRVRQRYVWRS